MQHTIGLPSGDVLHLSISKDGLLEVRGVGGPLSGNIGLLSVQPSSGNEVKIGVIR